LIIRIQASCLSGIPDKYVPATSSIATIGHQEGISDFRYGRRLLMKLQEKLDAHKKDFVSKVPADILAIMQRAKEDLARSGLLAKAVKVGDLAPDFELKDTEGKTVALGDLLDKGPLVLSFYRGRW